MFNTIKKLGELACVIKDEIRVSLDISECAAIAELYSQNFGGKDKSEDLDYLIKYLDSENHYYGSTLTLRVIDGKYDEKTSDIDFISWAVREIVNYRSYTNRKGYTKINDVWENVSEKTCTELLTKLALEMYEGGMKSGEVIDKLNRQYFHRHDNGIHLYFYETTHNDKTFILLCTNGEW